LGISNFGTSKLGILNFGASVLIPKLVAADFALDLLEVLALTSDMTIILSWRSMGRKIGRHTADLEHW